MRGNVASTQLGAARVSLQIRNNYGSRLDCYFATKLGKWLDCQRFTKVAVSSFSSKTATNEKRHC
jgi:hypothetical protein